MKKTALAVFAMGLALALAPVPAFAGSVYIPVIPPNGDTGTVHSTEVWVSNGSAEQRGFTTAFLPAETDGTQRTGTPPEVPVPAGRTFLLSNVGNGSGLLEVQAKDEMSVEAQVVNTSHNGLQTQSAVPVISAASSFNAGDVATLLGLERDATRGLVSHLGIVNLGTTASQCEVKVFRIDGTQIASTATLSFQPLSLRQFDDALGLLGQPSVSDTRAEVSCTQPFYAYVALFAPQNGQVWFLSPSASTGERSDDGGTDPPPSSEDSVIFRKDGHIHTATKPNNPKGKVFVPVAKSMQLKKMIVDVEFVRGPWNLEAVPGNHAIIWLYRGKFRSNTVVNVNAFGPGKFTLKMNQNVDLPAGHVTNAEVKVELEQGKRYRVHYVYDAQAQQVTAELYDGRTLVKSMTTSGTAARGILNVDPPHLNVEFGHYPGQHHPEIPSWGWSYHNLRVEMVPY